MITQEVVLGEKSMLFFNNGDSGVTIGPKSRTGKQVYGVIHMHLATSTLTRNAPLDVRLTDYLPRNCPVMIVRVDWNVK